MTIEIVDFPIDSMVIFYSFLYVYQMPEGSSWVRPKMGYATLCPEVAVFPILSGISSGEASPTKPGNWKWNKKRWFFHGIWWGFIGVNGIFWWFSRIYWDVIVFFKRWFFHGISGDLVGLGFWGHLMGFSACRPEPAKLLYASHWEDSSFKTWWKGAEDLSHAINLVRKSDLSIRKLSELSEIDRYIYIYNFTFWMFCSYLLGDNYRHEQRYWYRHESR